MSMTRIEFCNLAAKITQLPMLLTISPERASSLAGL
jgi:hypothetical protein